ncbi:MAG: hypothetical protein PHE88_08630 [Elusimicrobia bacterium]|nr:hypothetical protein [Elusimicrobiota bacterium]
MKIINRKYRIKGVKWALMLFLLTTSYLLLPTPCFSQVNPEVYFNSAIDKYIKGDYDSAIELFEKLLAENPQHQKSKEFLIKVLIEAAEKQVMLSNYTKAKTYIEKAKTIAPDNAKINELQNIIMGTPIKKEKEVIQQSAQTIKEPEIKMGKPKSTEKKIEKPQVTEKIKTPVFDEFSKQEKLQPKSYKEIFLVIGISLIVIILLCLVFYVWIKKKTIDNYKRMEELKNQIRAEAEKKFGQELEKIKKAEEERLKKEISEKLKLQIADKKAVNEKDGEIARRQFEATIEESKLLDTISDNIKREEYSEQVTKKMIDSLKTIILVNKSVALENILRLSKSNQVRLRYDCVKIIDSILIADTFKILFDMLGDSDNNVKKAVIISLNNICKVHPSEIPSDMISKAQHQITEEKIKNGWII